MGRGLGGYNGGSISYALAAEEARRVDLWERGEGTTREGGEWVGLKCPNNLSWFPPLGVDSCGSSTPPGSWWSPPPSPRSAASSWGRGPPAPRCGNLMQPSASASVWPPVRLSRTLPCCWSLFLSTRSARKKKGLIFFSFGIILSFIYDSYGQPLAFSHSVYLLLPCARLKLGEVVIFCQEPTIILLLMHIARQYIF